MNKQLLTVGVIGMVAGANAQMIYNGLDPAGANTTHGYYDTDGGSNTYGYNVGGEAGQLIYNTVNDVSITTVEAQFLSGSAPSSYTGGSSEMLLQLFNVVNGVPSNTPIDSAMFSLGNGIDGHTFSEVDWSYTQGHESGINVWNDAVSNLNWAITPGATYLISMQAETANAGYLGINNGTFTGTGNNGSNMNAYVRDFSSFGYAPIYGVSSWTETGTLSGLGLQSGNYNMMVNGRAAPEPASICALGLGLLAVIRRRRR